MRELCKIIKENKETINLTNEEFKYIIEALMTLNCMTSFPTETEIINITEKLKQICDE